MRKSLPSVAVEPQLPWLRAWLAEVDAEFLYVRPHDMRSPDSRPLYDRGEEILGGILL